MCIELLKIKYNDKKLIEEYYNLSQQLFFQYFSEMVRNEFLPVYNTDLISQEIKEKFYQYYLITLNKEIIGILRLQIQPDVLYIMEIYLKDEYRAKGYLKKILKQIKNIANENQLNKIKINIFETTPIIQEIFVKVGFIEEREVAIYIGNDNYLYEKVYVMC